ncbi:MAG: HD domain-containing protein [Candidatus Babeliales bacterium]|jgi:uncharacterized protein
MCNKIIIEQTATFVRSRMYGESSGHDWWHAERVWKNALYLCRYEQADTFTVQLAALLHDIADWKFHNGDSEVGPSVAREFLNTQKVENTIIDHVCEIMRTMSFKGEGVPSPMRTIEGKIVQDADRLDAMGAIGIARTFAFGGQTNREIYNPDVAPIKNATTEQYKKKGHSINHFYEKLFLLKDLMNTTTGRKLAEERHAFMELYLEAFFKEVTMAIDSDNLRVLQKTVGEVY